MVNPKSKSKKTANLPRDQVQHPLLNYILLFLACAFIGWIWEVLITFFKTGHIVNRGVLHGPWLPIYDVGGVIMALFLHRFEKRPWLVFLTSAASCGLLEYFTGWYLETFKHLKWWDYSDIIFNLNGRVCLLSIIGFGLCGLTMVYFLKPYLFNLFSHIPHSLKLAISLIFVFSFISDATYSSYRPNTGEGITNIISQTIPKS